MERAWQELFLGGGLAARIGRAHSRSVSRAVRRGELVRPLPGVCCPAGMETDLATRCAAVMAADPNAVITGTAAAALSWWPACPVRDVTAYRARPNPVAGYVWLSKPISDDLVHRTEGVNLAVPALAVLDMIPELGGRAIDEALRLRAASLVDIAAALALTPDRPGNAERRRLLDDSRDEPWSELERSLHGIVRALHPPVRWRTNVAVVLANGQVAFVDVAFPDIELGFEADGYEYHSSRSAFTHDRVRDARLGAQDWKIVRLPWDLIENDPDLTAELIHQIVLSRIAERRWAA